MMLPRDIYWFLFSVISSPKTFIRLSLANIVLHRISQDEQLHKKFIIRSTAHRYDFDEYFINLLANNKLHGKCIKWSWKEGDQISHSYEYNKGKINGYHTSYYPNGNLSKREMYKDDKLNGLCEIWYDNGKLSYRISYQNDEIHGLYESWFSNDKLHIKTTYVNGKLDGLYESWCWSGILMKTIQYKNGQEIRN